MNIGVDVADLAKRSWVFRKLQNFCTGFEARA